MSFPEPPVDGTPAVDLEGRLDQAVQAFYERRQRGEHIEYRAFLDEFAEVSAELAEFLKAAGALDALVEQVGSPSQAGPAASTQPDSPQELPQAFGDYELLAELGRGGMGVVFLARDRAAHRDVALKMILSGNLASAVEMQRFQLEAQAAARLDHPHIVPIYDVGKRERRPYFTMKLLPGGSLSERLREFGDVPKQAARMALAIAQAIAHAHARGVLHRDLKPANILLDQTGVPHVTDFGLAKCLDQDGRGDLTETGAVMGTPKYMAPEQAAGHSKGVTTAADVYSVGAILYELLTGQPPFDGSSKAHTYELILNSEPKRPRRIKPAVPVDLEVVCLKCLRKRPADRYESARALADDLQAFLDGRSILARPLGRAARSWRWCRHNRLVASLLALVFVLTTATAIATTVLWLRSESARQAAEDNARSAEFNNRQLTDYHRELELRNEKLEQTEHGLKLTNRDLDRSNRDMQRKDLLRQLLALRTNPHEQGWSGKAWNLIEKIAEIPRADDLHEAIDDRRDAALQPEVVASLGDLDVREINIESFRECTANAMVWDHPSRDRVLLGGVRKLQDERKVGAMLWDFVAGHAQDFPNAGEGPVAFLDGTAIQLELDRERGSLVLVDLAQRQVVRRFEVPGELHFASPTDLPWIAADASLVGAPVRLADGKELLTVWDGATGQELHRFEVVRARCVAFSADGTLIAAAGDDGDVRIWSLASGCKLGRLKNDGSRPLCLAFGPDGRRRQPGDGEGRGWRLAVGDSGGMAWIWDVDTGQRRAVCRGHGDEFFAVSFSPDGARLATAGRVHNCRIFDAETGAMLLQLEIPEHQHGLAFAPDGHRLAVSADSDRKATGTTRIWQLLDDRGCRTLSGLGTSVTNTMLSPDGRLVAALSQNWKIAVWDHLTGRRLHVFDAPSGPWTDSAGMAFSSDSSRLACAAGHVAFLWSLHTGERLGSWSFADGMADHEGLVNRLAFRKPDQLLLFRVETENGTRLPDNGAPPKVFPRVGRILDLQPGQVWRLVAEIPDFNWVVKDAQVTSDGGFVVAEGLAGERLGELIRYVRIYELATGLCAWSSPPLDKDPQSAARFRLDPLGKLLAIDTDNEGSVTFREIPSGVQKAHGLADITCLGPSNRLPIRWLGSPTVEAQKMEEKRHGLFELGRPDPLLTIFDRPRPERLMTGTRQDFSRDGRYIVWGNTDGTVTVADLTVIHSALAEFKLDW